MTPKITIVIPCYNCEPYIRRAIRSVKEQTSTHWELVVVDDGSTDGSREIIDEESRIGNVPQFGTIFFTKNKGVAAARNAAIERATTEWILPLDADDYLAPTAIAEFEHAIIHNPDADMFLSWHHHFGLGQDMIVKRTWLGYESLLRGNHIPNSVCYRKEDWRAVGGYRDGTMYEDWDLWIRILSPYAQVVTIPQALIHYRLRKGSRNEQARARNAEEHRIIREMNAEIYKRYGTVTR